MSPDHYRRPCWVDRYSLVEKTQTLAEKSGKLKDASSALLGLFFDRWKRLETFK